MKTLDPTQELYPQHAQDLVHVESFLAELRETLLTRTDGLTIKIQRDTQYPPLNGRDLMTGVVLKMWDISA